VYLQSEGRCPSCIVDGDGSEGLVGFRWDVDCRSILIGMWVYWDCGGRDSMGARIVLMVIDWVTVGCAITLITPEYCHPKLLITLVEGCGFACVV
jgi:hypothetical protein